MRRKKRKNEIPPVKRVLISQSYNYKILSKEERNYLAEKAKNNDIKARNKLIFSLLGLVNAIALHYRHYGVELEDLIQEGNLALLKAIETFDSKRGVDFSTHAFYQIRQAIQRTICNCSSIVNAPFWLIQKSHKNQKNNRYHFPLSWVSGDIMIDKKKYSDGDKIINLIPDKKSEREEDKILQKIDIEKFIDRTANNLGLNEKTKKILELHLQDNLNFAEIGKIMNLSRERVRVIMKKLMRNYKKQAPI